MKASLHCINIVEGTLCTMFGGQEFNNVLRNGKRLVSFSTKVKALLEHGTSFCM